MAMTLKSADRPVTDTLLERRALAWMSDPYDAVGYSNTRMHSVPREEAEALQLAGINIRLEQRRAEIPVLAKLAGAQEISRISRLEEAAPLFFTHDIYKSYPVSLLAKSRFDQLSKWLDRLTPYDLSGLSVGDCRSIDEWLDRLREQTPLDVATSSGTSGTLSFFPKTKRDYLGHRPARSADSAFRRYRGAGRRNAGRFRRAHSCAHALLPRWL
jgi:hypothetical protein